MSNNCLQAKNCAFYLFIKKIVKNNNFAIQKWRILRPGRIAWERLIKSFIPIKTSLDVKRLRSIWERELRDKARLYPWVDSKMGQSTFRANILLINNYSPKWRLFWLGGEQCYSIFWAEQQIKLQKNHYSPHKYVKMWFTFFCLHFVLTKYIWLFSLVEWSQAYKSTI